MELNRKRAKVVRLPTEESTTILRNTYRFAEAHGNPLKYGRVRDAIKRGYEYQHLYFTTDDEIKEGDWVLLNYPIGKKVKQMIKDVAFENAECINSENKFHNCNHRKIVATTDKLLLNHNYDDVDRIEDLEQYLPQPSEAFIQKYCEIGGIDEVDIEMEYLDSGWDSKSTENRLYKIKIDSHNTITIHPIKDSWNIDEVESLIFNFMKFFANKHKIRFDDGIKVSQWIEENLK